MRRLHLISVALSVIVGVLFVRHPGEGLLILTLLLIVFFMVEGISKLFCADNTAFSKLGLDVGKRHHWDTAVFLSLVQPSNNNGLAAWDVARDSTHL
jgi:hypothetical protein